jgi:hypothetical protein
VIARASGRTSATDEDVVRTLPSIATSTVTGAGTSAAKARPTAAASDGRTSRRGARADPILACDVPSSTPSSRTAIRFAAPEFVRVNEASGSLGG